MRKSQKNAGENPRERRKGNGYEIAEKIAESMDAAVDEV